MSFWQPVKPDDEAEKILLLGLARQRVAKELERAQKKLARESDKLHSANVHNATPRRRRNLRVNASLAAEERDRWEWRLALVDEWRAELMRENAAIASAK